MNTQPITKQDLTKQQLNITEIFYTIQGEGPWQGYPAIFIRLAGCNLQCTWCDTVYDTQVTLTEEQVVDEVVALLTTCEGAPNRIVITGGEPFAQNITPLVNLLWDTGFSVQIETNGTLSIPCFPFGKVTLVCSPKAGRIHADIEKWCRNYKYVVGAEDLHPATGFPTAPTQPNGKRPPPAALYTIDAIAALDTVIWLMPRDDKDDSNENRNAAVQLAMMFNRRLCLQQHKILGLN